MNNRLNVPIEPDARCQQEARKLWAHYDPDYEEAFWLTYRPLIEVARQHAQEAIIVRHQIRQTKVATKENEVSETFIQSRRHSFTELFYASLLLIFVIVLYKAHLHRQSPNNPGLDKLRYAPPPKPDFFPEALSHALNEPSEILDLGYLGMNKVPEQVGDLIHLERLYINDNELMFLPSALQQLPKLRHLNASKNEIFTINGIEKIKSLQSLYLQNNSLRSLPKNLGDLHHLEILFLEDNNLSELPTSIRYLKSLKSLYLRKNSLTSLPYVIGDMHGLKALYVEYNQLDELPMSIGRLKSLEFLDLEGNKLRSIPSEIAGMENLIRLDLSYNQMTYVTSSIRNLRFLYKLDLSHNQLHDLPSAFKQLTSLEELNLAGNPMNKTTVAKIKSWLPKCKVIF
ncbi:MAG TPA: hypothetical protein DCS93_16640 [Microscillaceae bacterium]|nr:hypothetical protein [Microscillaceae bacterium]